jgi:hypothetical protein
LALFSLFIESEQTSFLSQARAPSAREAIRDFITDKNFCEVVAVNESPNATEIKQHENLQLTENDIRIVVKGPFPSVWISEIDFGKRVLKITCVETHET